jgi:hypothetical protein
MNRNRSVNAIIQCRDPFPQQQTKELDDGAARSKARCAA